jgi:hypothetical protein
MRYTHENLGRLRAIVFSAAVVVIAVAYLISR